MVEIRLRIARNENAIRLRYELDLVGIVREGRTLRRTLGIRGRQIIYDMARHECENCGRHIEFSDMQVGHRIAYSRGGRATLKNSVALCYGCNRKQGTDSWQAFQRKQGKQSHRRESKRL